MADTLLSGGSERKLVRVQVSPTAPTKALQAGKGVAMNGADIFKFLCGLKLEFSKFDWLENRGLSEFELLISVILTQNTSWNNVLKALDNVRVAKIQSLEMLNKR